LRIRKWWELVDYLAHLRGYDATQKPRGLLSQLTPAQRKSLFDYKRPVASGGDNWPKVKARENHRVV